MDGVSNANEPTDRHSVNLILTVNVDKDENQISKAKNYTDALLINARWRLIKLRNKKNLI